MFSLITKIQEPKENRSQLPNKRKMTTPRKLMDYNPKTWQKNKKTQTFNNDTGCFMYKHTPKHANNSNENVAFRSWSNDYRLPTASPLPRAMSKEAQMVWLRNKRNVGLWAMCDRCKKWRFLVDITDPLDLPDKWYCYMNAGECIKDL